ncbi:MULTISPECIES: hypothetical protein [Streptococcus]|uniref:hypothetical protein n=1 Tax=Streptococcus TaxID=1301 RepID=UPI0022840309|nr:MULTISPECIES: hypothetical protein [Streptococcus]MCY7026203.1 hypothetical protein [Streptococcus sanguinis]WNU94377.1 hypothetical protein RSK81_10065 [Streptococcus sp. DTU_2020_1000888_1_SI_GRL_NUU_041A]
MITTDKFPKFPEPSIPLIFDIELEKLEGKVDHESLDKNLKEEKMPRKIQIYTTFPNITNKTISFKWSVSSRNDWEACKKNLENLEAEYFFVPYKNDNQEVSTPTYTLTKIIKVIVQRCEEGE